MTTGNGMLDGAQAEYEAKLNAAEEISTARYAAEIDLRKNYSIGDLLNAIVEAPDRLMDQLFEQYRNGHMAGIGHVIFQMAEHDIRTRADRQVMEERKL